MSKKTDKMLSILGTFILLVFLLPSSALSESSPDPLSGVADEGMILFQEIPSVYSASKYEQKVTEAPSSVSIVTAAEIKKFGYQTLADILRSLRGFYTSYDRNYDYLGVRGFLRPGDYNTRVLILVDGHRTNENVYDSASIGTEFILDVDLIDRVEVVRGPSSSLYGANAFFAVVNVITRKGRELKGAEISGEYGTFDTFKGRLSYGNRLRNGLEILLSGTYYDSEGDDRLFFKEFDDPLTNNGIAENGDNDTSYSFFGEMSYLDFTLQGAYVDREKVIPTAPWDIWFNDPRNKLTDGMAYLDLKYVRHFENDLSVLARVNYNNYWYDGDYVYDWNEDPSDPFLVLNKDEARGEWVGAEVALTKRVFGRHKVTFGGEYRNNFRQDQKNFDEVDPPDIYLDDKRDSYFWGIFFQDEIEILSDLILNAGVRHDHYSTFGGTTNPRLALIYTPFEKTTFKVLYGTAFRSPSAYELYYHDGPTTQRPNPDLDAETIDTYEVVYEQYIGDHLRGTALGFYYEINDLISQDLDDAGTPLDPDDDLIFFNNIDEIEAHGFELELEGKWESGLEGRVSYAYQESENKTTDSELENSPRHLVKFNLIAPLVSEKIFAGAELQYASKRKTLAGNHAASFFITNLTIFGKELAKGLEVSGTLYNLFDEEYGDPGSEEHRQDVIEQDGRTFRVKLTYMF